MNVPDHVTKALFLFFGMQFTFSSMLAVFTKHYWIAMLCNFMGVWLFSYLFKEKPKFKKQYKIVNPNKGKKR